VTDGETNASLRAADSVDEITPERARELLQERRERGPAKRRKPGSRKS
jgi:DNA topoisomerase I